MLAALTRIMGRGVIAPPEPITDALPAELVAAINSAMCQPRGEPDPETGETRLLVKVAGLGAWHWDGLDPAADRVKRHWPDLSPRACRRAAALLGSVIAVHTRRDPRPRGRGGWVWDF